MYVFVVAEAPVLYSNVSHSELSQLSVGRKKQFGSIPCDSSTRKDMSHEIANIIPLAKLGSCATGSDKLPKQALEMMGI